MCTHHPILVCTSVLIFGGHYSPGQHPTFRQHIVDVPSWPFFSSAWRALKTRTLSMAVLVVLSRGTGYFFRVGTILFFKCGQFFEAVAVLLVFILRGH